MFMGGFVDAVVGGGGLLTLPAYFMLNLPIANVMGTNKFSASISTIFSFLQYLKSNQLNLKFLLKLVPFSLVGSMCGVFLFYQIKAEFLEQVIPFMIIAIGIYSLIDKKLGQITETREYTKKDMVKGSLLTFFIGMYDGFFGPGTGVFFTLMQVKLFKINFVGSSGGSKLLNVASGLTAFVLYAYNDAVVYKYGLIGLFFSSIGVFCGGYCAIKKGSKFIKPFFTGISFLLALNLLLRRYGIVFFQ